MMVQVLYFVEGVWKPGEPMTLHWSRPFSASVETITTTGTGLAWGGSACPNCGEELSSTGHVCKHAHHLPRLCPASSNWQANKKPAVAG